ncbi:MAG: hypothetical protein O3A46_16165 [Candidatus Poribacteria bacterium]|nr:hypothetical protein [Candidatus Poribacteria bacterium]
MKATLKHALRRLLRLARIGGMAMEKCPLKGTPDCPFDRHHG